MVNEFMRQNMTESSYRPEQMFVRDFLFSLHPKWKIKLEYPIRNLKLDGKPYKKCILDIAILKGVLNCKVAIRLNGGYHFSSSLQRTKDEFQKEALKQAGWEVLDFDHFKMPNLFKRKKKKETIKLAEEEILKVWLSAPFVSSG